MGDQLVKDFFDLDMKEKMQLIESRKKIEKELVRMVYAPVLMMYTSGLERQYNRDLNGIVSAAKEDIQVVGKQIDQSVTDNLLNLSRPRSKKKQKSLHRSN